MDWLTLPWLMENLEWAVGLLGLGCILLFFLPIVLGWQLQSMDSTSSNNTAVIIFLFYTRFRNCKNKKTAKKSIQIDPSDENRFKKIDRQ